MRCEAVSGSFTHTRQRTERRVRNSRVIHVSIWGMLTATRINEDTVESLCEVLRSANTNDTITANVVGGLLEALEDQDGVLCCSINIKTFCAVLNTVLHSENCREGERILVLLAVSTKYYSALNLLCIG